MDYNTIVYQLADGVAKITLDRPDKLNAFNEKMHDELRAALDAAEAEATARAVLITGAGRAFCAGQDLGDRATRPGDGPPDLGETIGRLYNPLVRRLRGLRLPVVCAVNGVAAGAGANLALASDLAIAARSAKFVQPFCRLGLVPDTGGTFFLPRLVGHARAIGLALLGDSISAEQAETWGLIWRCVDDEDLMNEAETLAKRLATQPTRGLELIKQALNASAANTLDEQLDLERDLQREAGRTEDYREGVSAFLEKRQPSFRGR